MPVRQYKNIILIVYLTDMDYSPIKGRQTGAGIEITPDAIVAEVARMLSEWEDSGELTTAFARRVVATVFRLQREIR